MSLVSNFIGWLVCGLACTALAQAPNANAPTQPDEKSDWWSFKPASRPIPPAPALKSWPRNPIDRFILARLESEHLAPTPEADRRTLIRRLNFDLTGLPPTPAEVARFETDSRPDAYEQLVDRLLDSPRYGERWARHWLDVVHYGETHGYDKDKPRPNAWPYRDYVIRAFNQDKPYSRFVQEQLAGDALFPDDPDGIAALGFIAAGPWDFVGHVELPIEKRDGLIARYNDRDDMLMSTFSTFQSLTVHCARCHDHKFDPITQKDYYRLQAVFAGVDRADRPFDADPKVLHERRALIAQKQEKEVRRAALTNLLATLTSPELQRLDSRLGEIASRLAAIGSAAGAEKSPSNGYHSGIEKTRDVPKWVQVDLGQVQPLDEVRLIPARPVDFIDTPGFGFPVRFRIELAAEADFKTSELITDQTQSDFANPGDHPVAFPIGGSRGRFVRITATTLWERTSDFIFALGELQVFRGSTNLALQAGVTALDSIEAGLWARKNLVDGFDSRQKLEVNPASVAATHERAVLETEQTELREKRKSQQVSLLPSAEREELARLTEKLSEIARQLAALPPPQKVYAATRDFPPEGNFHPAGKPRPVHLLARGDVARPGDLMTPAGIAAVTGPDPDFEIANPEDESARRAALARWLTDSRNLLTRRSIVNRVWHYHFGRGIVETPNDFGHMGARPTHPELLDWLAFWFQDHGESLKQLHRLMVTSATYRQGSASQAAWAKVDADNRFLWRMNRARLDAESIRDAMLAIAGQLDLTMGGPSLRQFYFKDDHSPVYDYTRFDADSPDARRRSIYRFLVRSVPDPMMDSLDCPDASISAPRRNTTMTALQALTLLNNSFVLKQCEHLATRVAGAGAGPAQITELYRLALNRQPTASELAQLVPFAQQHGLANACRVVFNLSEFMFLD